MKTTPKKIDGVLLLNKESGITSNRALQNVKHFFGAAKAGHAGSLDPLASGVLPICFGEATKFARFLLDAEKTYEVRAKLGITTDTGDCTGTILQEAAIPDFSPQDILQHIEKFRGRGTQIPSMYSALKHKGQPLYKFARQNITIERAPRPIEVFEYDLLDFNTDLITCKIKCSKGTYVRTLIEDLGTSLGCGAHVISLRRITAGPFSLRQCIDFKTLQTSDLNTVLLPTSVLLSDLPKVVLSNGDARRICLGQKVYANSAPEGMVCLWSDENELLGIAQAETDGHISPLRLVADPQFVVQSGQLGVGPSI